LIQDLVEPDHVQLTATGRGGQCTADVHDHVVVAPRCVLELAATHDHLVVEDLVQDLQQKNDLVVLEDVQLTATGDHGYQLVVALEPVVEDYERTHVHVTTLLRVVVVDHVLENLWKTDLVEQSLVQFH